MNANSNSWPPSQLPSQSPASEPPGQLPWQRSAFRRLVKMLGSAETGVRFYHRLNQALGWRGRFLFVACMPKSGSTFVCRALQTLTGYPARELSYAYERTEQDLYLPKVVDAARKGCVVQQHVQATGANLEIMQKFAIRPVILVRNLFDVVVSIRDYLFVEGFEKFPSLYATDALAAMPLERQHDFLITFAMPWYFDFYVSWFDATRDKRVESLWLSYDDLRSDWAAGISQILDHYGIERSESEIAETIDFLQGQPSSIRFNRGVSGRGTAALTPEQKQRLLDMAAMYPWVDFSSVGLHHPGAGNGASPAFVVP